MVESSRENSLQRRLATKWWIGVEIQNFLPIGQNQKKGANKSCLQKTGGWFPSSLIKQFQRIPKMISPRFCWTTRLKPTRVEHVEDRAAHVVLRKGDKVADRGLVAQGGKKWKKKSGMPSLKLTAKAPENRPSQKEAGSYSNHHFSGAKMLVSRRVSLWWNAMFSQEVYMGVSQNEAAGTGSLSQGSVSRVCFVVCFAGLFRGSVSHSSSTSHS